MYIALGVALYLVAGAVVTGLVARLIGEPPSAGLGLISIALWPALLVVVILAFIVGLVAAD